MNTRSLLELDLFLRRTYEDSIVDCPICNYLVTLGHACSNPDCEVRVHRHCFKAHVQHASKCIKCGTKWTKEGAGVTGFGEDGVSSDFDSGISNKRRRRREDDEDADGDDSMEEEVDEKVDSDDEKAQKPLVKKGQGKGRLARKSTMTQ